MIFFLQICVLLIAIQWWNVASSPLFESINIERKLNIGFKPLKFRPISFIKEKWGPFGRYGKKHTIERRDLDAMNTIDSSTGEIIKPVTEMIEEPIKIIPVPSYRPPIQAIMTDTKESETVSKLNTDISAAIPPNPYFMPAKKPELEGLGAVPIVETSPIEGPLFVPVTPAPAEVPPPPPSPKTPPVEEPPRFGGLARFFGDIISEIFNRILARARMSFFPNSAPPAQ